MQRQNIKHANLLVQHCLMPQWDLQTQQELPYLLLRERPMHERSNTRLLECCCRISALFLSETFKNSAQTDKKSHTWAQDNLSNRKMLAKISSRFSSKTSFSIFFVDMIIFFRVLVKVFESAPVLVFWKKCELLAVLSGSVSFDMSVNSVIWVLIDKQVVMKHRVRTAFCLCIKRQRS